MDFAISADHRVKLKEDKKREKCLDLARERKKTMEHKSDDDANYNSYAWYCHQRISKGLKELE